MSGTTVTSTHMKQRHREAIWVSSVWSKTPARIQLVLNSGKPHGKFSNQRIESLRLINKERVAGVFEQFDLRCRSIFFEIRRLPLVLWRHDVEQWLLKPAYNVSPMGTFERIVQ